MIQDNIQEVANPTRKRARFIDSSDDEDRTSNDYGYHTIIATLLYFHLFIIFIIHSYFYKEQFSEVYNILIACDSTAPCYYLHKHIVSDASE